MLRINAGLRAVVLAAVVFLVGVLDTAIAEGGASDKSALRSGRRVLAPRASGDSLTSCQETDLGGQGEAGTLAASSCANIVADNNDDPIDSFFRVAETFGFLTPGTVSAVTWKGIYRDFNAAVDCTDAFPDDFTLLILGDNDGLPDDDNVVAVLDSTTGVFSRETTSDILVVHPVHEHTFTFNEPLDLDLESYHLVAQNSCIDNFDKDGDGPFMPEQCIWLWVTAPPGDTRSHQDVGPPDDPDDPDDVPGEWDPTDESDYDLDMCWTFESAGQVFLPPSARFEVERPADIETGCCVFTYHVRNRISPGPSAELTEFYLEFNKGTGDTTCEGISDISAPAGWDVEFCEPWNEGRAVFRFSGAALESQAETFGQIRIPVNGDEPVTVMIRDLDAGEKAGEPVVVAQEIPAFGVRAWGSFSDPAGGCGSGTFGPQDGQTGDWHIGNEGVCTLEAIPSLTNSGRFSITLLIAAAGALLLLRSRKSALAGR